MLWKCCTQYASKFGKLNNGNPLQFCSCLENPRDRGAWWAAVSGVAQSWTWLKQLSSSSSAVVWAFFGIAFLWDWNETDLFQSSAHCWVFQICWHTECSTFIASSLRIWNSSTGIPSPTLALFVVILSKAHLTLARGRRQNGRRQFI